MKNHRLLISIGASIASLLSGLLPAAADQTYNGASVYRDTDTIYKVGVTPNLSVPVTYTGATISQTTYSDACGVLKISLGASLPTDLTINRTAFAVSSAPEFTPKYAQYKCKNGVATYTGFANTTGAFRIAKYSNGDPINTALYISNPTIVGGANKSSLMAYTGSIARKFKANACGFITIKPSSLSPFSSTSVVNIDESSSNYTFGSLPQTPTPPVCTDGKTYLSSTAPITYNGSNFYRTTKAVYYTGLTPSSLNTVELTGLASKDISYYKGNPQYAGYVPMAACGLFYIDFKKVRVPSLKIGATNNTISAIPTTNAALSCDASNLATLTPNTLYLYDTLFNGGASRFVYRVSDVSQKKITIEYPTTFTKNLPVNACGFAEIKSLNSTNGFSATDKVKVNGTEYTVSTLPLAPTAPMCKNGVAYQATP
jgi:hypothetical protein